MSEVVANDAEAMATAGEPAKQSQGSLYFPGLDGLRTIAFLMVFMLHAIPRSALPSGSFIRSVRDSGAYGVPLFFALSSFLITSLLMEEKRESGAVHVPAFYYRRILRIWPLYFLIILLGWLTNSWLTASEPLTAYAAFRFVTFSANFFMSGNVRIPETITQLWSVCVEEQFYLCWPWVIRFLSKRNLTIFAILLLIAGNTFRMTLVGRDLPAVWFQSITHIDCFAYGCLAALYLRGRTPGQEGLRAAIFAGCIAAIFVVEWLVPFRHFSDKNTAAGMFTYSAIAALCATCVWLASTMTRSFLASKPMVELGKITYGLYCFHTLAIHAMQSRISNEYWWLIAILSLGLTILLALTSYRLYELRFLRLKRKYQVVKSGSI